LGGIGGFNSTKNINIITDGKLSTKGAIVRATGNMAINADDIQTDDSSIFMAGDLDMASRKGIYINTLVDKITAETTGKGDVTINEGNDVLLENVIA